MHLNQAKKAFSFSLPKKQKHCKVLPQVVWEMKHAQLPPTQPLQDLLGEMRVGRKMG